MIFSFLKSIEVQSLPAVEIELKDFVVTRISLFGLFDDENSYRLILKGVPRQLTFPDYSQT
ncbi:hypothetical protein DV872_26045 [Oceanispirochaeta sp. M1]|nr:hypothetical protein DV872_26045 [Oceanispirochaeta sp. M1]